LHLVGFFILNQIDTLISQNFYFGMKLYMFRTVPLSIIRSFPFHPDPASKLSANLYDIYHCCVYSARLLMTEELSETCRVSFQNKNFEKLVHLVGSIIRNLS